MIGAAVVALGAIAGAVLVRGTDFASRPPAPSVPEPVVVADRMP